MRVIYHNGSGPRLQSGFRGETSAWLVQPDRDRPVDERLDEFPLTESLYQALVHLGLVERLEALPHFGMLSPHEEGILLPDGLETAAGMLQEAADALPSGPLEWVCSHQVVPERIEYRLATDADVVREQLLELAGFFASAGRLGLAIQLWL